MKVDDEERDRRLKEQKEAQARLEAKRGEANKARLQDLEDAKKAAMLKAASSKR